MIELGDQPTIQSAEDAFVDVLIDRGEDCIDGPVYRVMGQREPIVWADFHERACCGYETAQATISETHYEFAATFGH